MARKGYSWQFVPQKPKFTTEERAEILKSVQDCVNKSEKLKKSVNRTSMRGSWIYFYTLIEDEHFEIPYARISLKDKAQTQCSLDWQRYNDQWISLHEGSLQECLKNLEENEWFDRKTF